MIILLCKLGLLFLFICMFNGGIYEESLICIRVLRSFCDIKEKEYLLIFFKYLIRCLV